MSKPFPTPADNFQRIEVITGTGRRRKWPEDVKAAIVAETLQEGAVITEIALRHRVSSSQIFTWRKKAREQALANQATSFAPVVVEPEHAPLPLSKQLPSAMIEIEAEGVRLRIPANASREVIFAVIEAVGGLQKRRR